MTKNSIDSFLKFYFKGISDRELFPFLSRRWIETPASSGWHFNLVHKASGCNDEKKGAGKWVYCFGSGLIMCLEACNYRLSYIRASAFINSRGSKPIHLPGLYWIYPGAAEFNSAFCQ